MLRSFRFGEADRVLHVYTLDRGRVGAVAKGVRKTKSRFGARLEPLSHVELLLHQGSGELHTVTGASLVDPHRPRTGGRVPPVRRRSIGAEAMLRLYVEEEQNERAFEALTRFLERRRQRFRRDCGGGRGLDPLALGVPAQAALALRLRTRTWTAASSAATTDGLVGYLPSAGGAVCSACAPIRDRRADTRGLSRHPGSRVQPARGGARPRAGRACCSGCACRGRRLVRVPRRLPPPHAVRVKRELARRLRARTTIRDGSTARRCTGF